MSSAALDRLLDAAFVQGLRDLSIAEVRARRTECQSAETELSYLRRIVQGRLDIVQADLHRRAGGAPGDMASLVEQLPAILGREARPGGVGRLSSLGSPTDELHLMGEADAIFPPSRLAHLPELSDDDLAEVAARLADFEREVSASRRALHERIDALQEEIVRRYQSGEATVDSLLR